MCVTKSTVRIIKHLNTYKKINTVMRPMKISVEGNISSGKSTLLQYFQKYLHVETYPEPIDKWRNVNGNNLLNELYSDLKRFSFMFRNYVQLTFLETQCSLPSPNTSVQLFERSIQSNRYCFIEQALKSNFLNRTEYDVLINWYDTVTEIVDVKLDLIVYLRTEPKVAFERMQLRRRKEENLITLDYLENLHEMHEEWLMSSNKPNIPILIIDANKDMDELKEVYKINKNKILRQGPHLKLFEII